MWIKIWNRKKNHQMVSSVHNRNCNLWRAETNFTLKQRIITFFLLLWLKLTVFALFFSPTSTCSKAKFRKHLYLFKQILSWFSLVRIQIYLSHSLASGKWVIAKIENYLAKLFFYNSLIGLVICLLMNTFSHFSQFDSQHMVSKLITCLYSNMCQFYSQI